MQLKPNNFPPSTWGAATSFLKNMHPLEPEMVLQLTSMKIAWSNSRTKPFTAPTPAQTQHKVHQKYLARSKDDEDLTFLDWLRQYDHEKNPPKRYKDGSTLVGVKHFSMFNLVYFYQLLIMNLPHRTLDELHDLREDRLPDPIKHFVPAKEKLPNILGSRDTILEYLSSESHKELSGHNHAIHAIPRRSVHAVPTGSYQQHVCNI